jgi:tRNA-uridine 2-sulfurtransferase
MSPAAALRAPAAARIPAELPADPLDLLPAGAVVAVAMSGGVDSSVAAARCVERGLQTVGITLAMWPRDRAAERDHGCCGVDAVADARRVAAALGIRHYAWNLEEQFHDSVIRDFEDEYQRGRTPNPCVRCNDRIKFGELLQRALAVGATHVATGHYARIGRRGERWSLHRGADPCKDQAYTLYSLGQARLGRAVFPVGALPSKDEVRRQAKGFGLITADKTESQELCFVAGRLSDALESRLAGRFTPGPIFDVDGAEVGRHRGLPFYTVGQRSRLGLRPTHPDAAPLHVLRIDARHNALVVGPRADLHSRFVDVVACSWIDAVANAGARCQVQLRAHGEAHDAVVDVADECGLRVRFVEPVAQVAPGQALVVCAGDEVLGGGTIEAAG